MREVVLLIFFYMCYDVPMADEKKELSFDERLLDTRTILVTGEIDKDQSESFVQSLLVLNQMSETKPIYVLIDSPGGDVDAAYAMVDMMGYIKAPVFTVGMGLVASAGALLLLGVEKQRRFGLTHSHYLLHQPLSEFEGVATDIAIHAKQLEYIREVINEHISRETGKELAIVARDTERDFWLNAEEAIAYGLITRVIKSSSELPKK